MRSLDILKLLSRTDKHFLGGGNRLIWAPEFPVHLDAPGFWDQAHYFNYPIQPLFTWTLLDDSGQEIPLRFQSRTWDPSCLTQQYMSSPEELKIKEEKTIIEDDVAVCLVSIRSSARKPRRFHLVGWTVQENTPSKKNVWLSEVERTDEGISFVRHMQRGEHPPLGCAMLFAMNRNIHSFSIVASEGRVLPPRWRFTPFYETFEHGRLPGTTELRAPDAEGVVFMALHAEINVGQAETPQVAITMSVAPRSETAQRNIWPVTQAIRPGTAGEWSWRHYFRTVPSFQCSDEYLTRYYWYRWYGLRLNTINVNEGNYHYPFVCEGIGYFRAPISYSAMCHMRETRWMHAPDLARGILRTFIDNQRPDGGFRGYIDVNYYRQEMFYHANWGEALLQLYRVHPSGEYLAEVYERLKAYVAYFDRERDEEVSGLYDIDNHYETGQEFMHRYIAVNPAADRDNWGEVFRLKGVDVTVYIYELKRALAFIATTLGKHDEAELRTMEAEWIKKAVLERMWDPEQQMFFDINPATGQRTGIKAAVCFYPYFTDIVSEEHLPGLKQHLFDPHEFWTPYPVPSSSADDPYFSGPPEWKGKRMNCPWNGRVWPMTNSHIAEALARSAIRFNDRELRRRTVDFITKYIRIMFFDGDPERPNCFEHYNPFNGKASIYRGIDDYQHSWVVDLIIQYVCGVRTEAKGVVIDPFPFELDHLLLDDVMIGPRRLKVELKGKHFTVWVDGQKLVTNTIGHPVEIPYGASTRQLTFEQTR